MASDTRIVYTFVASGQQSVADAFQSIERAAKKSAKAVEQSTKDGAAAQRTAGTRVEREAERIAAAQKRAADKAADAQAKAAERSAAARVKAEERAQQQIARVAERAQAQELRSQERHQEQLRRQLEKRAAAEARAHQKIADERSKHWKGLGRDVAFSAAATAVAGATALAGAVARDAMRLEDATTRLSVSSRGAGQAFADPRKLQEEFRAVAVKTGVGSGDIAGGMASFVSKTGRLDLGRKFAETIGYTASATGANVEDVSATAADLVTKFKIEDVEDLQAAMAGLAYQGKLGAFELKDAASQFARMGAAAASFGIGTGPQAVRVLGGLAQIARDATGSPEQASTAVEHVFSAFISKGSKIKQEGVDVFRNNKARDPRDILVDLISKAGGTNKAVKLEKMKEIFGDFGIRAVNPLVAAFGSAYDSAQGTEKQRLAIATAALRQRIDDAVDAAGDWSEVLRDSERAQRTTSAQFQKVWESAMQQLTPLAIEALPLVVDAIKQGAAAMLAVAKMLGYRPQEKTHAENAQELQAKADDAKGRLEKARADKKPKAVIEKLAAEQAMYQSQADAESAQVMAPAATVFGKDMTEEEFTTKLAELGDKSGQSWLTQKQLAGAATAQASGSQSILGTIAGVGLTKSLPGLVGQLFTGRWGSIDQVAAGFDSTTIADATPEQKALIEQYAAQVRQGLGSPKDPSRGGPQNFVEVEGRMVPALSAGLTGTDALRGNGPKGDQGAADAYKKKVQELLETANQQKSAYDAAAEAARKFAEDMKGARSPTPSGGSGGSVVVGG